MARLRLPAVDGVYEALLVSARDAVEQWGSAGMPLGPLVDLLVRLEAGEPVVVPGWRVASHVPGSRLAEVPWVRVSPDGSITVSSAP
jgi:hypothetical protein